MRRPFPIPLDFSPASETRFALNTTAFGLSTHTSIGLNASSGSTGKRHPNDLGPAEVESFLTNLAVARRVAASTQNQAKSALLFLYKEVLGIELPWLEGIEKAKVPRRLPVVLTREETKRALEQLHDIHALIGRLLYGTGMRVMEGMRLRVKDMDFA